MASDDTNAGEIKSIRQRLHDLSDVMHARGLDVARHELEIQGMKAAIENLSEKTATRDQLESASSIMTLKLNQVSDDVVEVRRWIIAGVSIVLTSVIIAVIALVLRGPQ